MSSDERVPADRAERPGSVTRAAYASRSNAARASCRTIARAWERAPSSSAPSVRESHAQVRAALGDRRDHERQSRGSSVIGIHERDDAGGDRDVRERGETRRRMGAVRARPRPCAPTSAAWSVEPLSATTTRRQHGAASNASPARGRSGEHARERPPSLSAGMTTSTVVSGGRSPRGDQASRAPRGRARHAGAVPDFGARARGVRAARHRAHATWRPGSPTDSGPARGCCRA